MPKPKIIQIGFNKCGTRSMYNFFKRNGISCKHWEHGKVGRDMAINMTTGKAPFHGHEDAVFYSDLMGPHGLPVFEHQWHFRELYAAYPDALFILNTRNVDNWIASRLRHPDFVARFFRHYRLESKEEVEALWRAQWHAHHAAVVDFFADKPSQFLLFDIEAADGAALAGFVDAYYRCDPALWGHVGKAPEKADQAA